MNIQGIYDYIIIGAGSAGCVLANRLSADPDVSVLLLEAGGKDNWHWFHIPVGYLYCIGNPRADWCYQTEPQAGLNGRAINYPRGKVLGGSSSINAMLYLRGQRQDYDGWRDAGNPGWGWDDVLPIFKRSEDDYALFIFAAILPWKWFSSAVGDAITSVSGQDRLIKQVQFPKIVLPVAAILAGIAQFAFGMIPLAALLGLLYADRISPALVLIPVVAAVQLVFTLALGVLVAALNVFFRDIGNLSRHALRLWFYLSPALYGAAVIEEIAASHQYIAGLIRVNPFYPILNAYRSVIYEGTAPDWTALGGVLGISAIFLLAAVWFFKRVEPTFAKVL